MTCYRPKVSLPAVLLVFASALSCSTACITPAVVAIGAAAGAGTAALSVASAELEKNRAARLGSTAVPVVTADPASIEQALRPALPVRASGGMPDAGRLRVILRAARPDQPDQNIYDITARGAFTPAYAQAFASFANKLRQQLPGRTKFVVLAIDDADGRDRLVARLEVD